MTIRGKSLAIYHVCAL